ncbi:globoside alpha-1,3-N-acetylgalactosaminyltransferase 1, partial [Candidatus Woesearchaeota archaeon]|nr:globoside alpha-1,3-N-acetylgalactosaminyltransferase 1 [Candidatus Woesearchaeota archaeon]
MKVGLLIIATNKYTQFLQPLIESADKYFLPNQEVTYFVFTNQEINIDTDRSIVKNDVEHKEW